MAKLDDVRTIKERKPLNKKEEEYLVKIIEKCQERDLPIVLIKTPSTVRIGSQPYYNAVQIIADQYKVPFINYNLIDEQTGIEANDFANTHVNYRGAAKTSRCWTLIGTNRDEGEFSECVFGDGYSEFMFGSHVIKIYFEDKGNILMDENIIGTIEDKGLFCFVFDMKKIECIDTICFMEKDNYLMRHCGE